MMEISSAVSSSISSTSAGMVARPAALDARQRRSPAISWNSPSSSGRTRIGCRTPCSRIDAASSSSVARRTTSARLLGVRLDPVDGDVADAAARATVAVVRQQADDGGGELALLREAPRGGGAEISPSQGRPPPARARGMSEPRPMFVGVGRDRPPDERRLAELHRVADDRVEDVVVADDPQLVEHVAREVGAAVEERRQQAQDLAGAD